jgi:hypothetical protein
MWVVGEGLCNLTVYDVCNDGFGFPFFYEKRHLLEAVVTTEFLLLAAAQLTAAARKTGASTELRLPKVLHDGTSYADCTGLVSPSPPLFT